MVSKLSEDPLGLMGNDPDLYVHWSGLGSHRQNACNNSQRAVG